MRIAAILFVIAACGTPASVLEIHTSDGKPFTRIELFFTDGAIDPVTDAAMVPRSTPTVLRASGDATELDVRKYDPADIYDAPTPTDSVTLGVPHGLGAGKYLAVIASDSQGPIEWGEVTEFRDHEVVRYVIDLQPIVNAPPTIPALPEVTIKVPCEAGGTVDNCPHKPIMAMMLDGVPIMKSYKVTVRVRGVMEPSAFRNGSPSAGIHDGWYVGGTNTTPNPGENAFVLHTTAPDMTYYLNDGIGLGVRAWDYFATLQIDAGSSVVYTMIDNDGQEQRNTLHLQAGVAGIDASPGQFFDGQYAAIDIVDVVELAANTVRDWPRGVELWSQPAGKPSCLRITTDEGTHLVTTAGDQDCDGFADDKVDCDATLYCDPAKGSLGCVALCAENFSHQSGQVRLGTCVNGRIAAASDDDPCPGTDAPPSYCIGKTAQCPVPIKPPIPLHQQTLACVLANTVDVSCTYTINATPCTDAQVAIDTTALQCSGITILAQTGAPAIVHQLGGQTCTLSFQFESAPGDATQTTLMLGVPAIGGGYDTLVVKIGTQVGACTASPTCVTMNGSAEPHECKAN